MSGTRNKSDSSGFEDLAEELEKWDETFDSLHEADDAEIPSPPARAEAAPATDEAAPALPRSETYPALDDSPLLTPTPTPTGLEETEFDLDLELDPISEPVPPPAFDFDDDDGDEVEISIVADEPMQRLEKITSQPLGADLAIGESDPFGQAGDPVEAPDPFVEGEFEPMALADLFEPAAKRRGPAIVRREDLERRKLVEAGVQLDEDAADEWDRPSITNVMAQETVDRMVETAAAFFADEEDEEPAFELDTDFYDDIEIDETDDNGGIEIELPVRPVSSEPSRRIMAHVVRREPVASTHPPPQAPLVDVDTAVRLEQAELDVGERVAPSAALEAAERAIGELFLEDRAEDSGLLPIPDIGTRDLSDEELESVIEFEKNIDTGVTEPPTLDTALATVDQPIAPTPFDEPRTPQPSPLEKLGFDLPPQLPTPRLVFTPAKRIDNLELRLPETGDRLALDSDARAAELEDAEEAIAQFTGGSKRATLHRWAAGLAFALGDLDGAEAHSRAASQDNRDTSSPGFERRLLARAGRWDELADAYGALESETGAVLAGELAIALGRGTGADDRDGERDAGALLRAAVGHARAGDVSSLAARALDLSAVVADDSLRRALAGLWLRASSDGDPETVAEATASVGSDIALWETAASSEPAARAAIALILADAYAERGDPWLADGLRIVGAQIAAAAGDRSGARSALVAAADRSASHPAVCRPLLDLLDADDNEVADFLVAVVSGSPAAPLAARALWRWSQSLTGSAARERLRRAHALAPKDALILASLEDARESDEAEAEDEVGLALAPSLGGDLVDSLNRARDAHLSGDAEARERALAGIELPTERLLVVGERLAHIGRGAELGAPATGIAHEVLWRHRALANLGKVQPSAVTEELTEASANRDRMSARARLVTADALAAAASEKLWQASESWSDHGGRVELAQARLAAYLETTEDGLRLSQEGADVAFATVDEWQDPRVRWLSPASAARGGDWPRAADGIAKLGEGSYRSAYLLTEYVEDHAAAEAVLAELVADRPLEYVAELTSSVRRKLGVLAPEATTMPEAAQTSVTEPFAGAVRAAEAHESRNDFGSAIGSYRRALEMRPGDPVALFGLEWACAREKEAAPIAELALAELRAAEEAGDRGARADAYEALARIDDAISGDAESAAISWESAADSDPSRLEALRALERMQLASGQSRDLLKTYGRLLALIEGNHDEAALRLERTRVAVLAGRDAGEVAADYAEILELDPDARMPLFHIEERARRQPASRERAEIEVKVAKALAADPRSAAAFLCRSGETLTELELYEEAIRRFGEATDASPGHPPALEGWRRAAARGELWVEFARACELSSEVEDTDVKRSELLHLGGVALMDRAMDGAGAVKALEGAIAVGFEGDDAFARLRVLFDETGDDERLGDLLRARLQSERDASARLALHLELANLCRNFWNDRAGAIQHLRAALDIEPHNETAVADLSDISWELGAWDLAAETLLVRAKLETKPSVLKHIFYRLGTIYADHLPDPSWAVRCFKTALTHDPDDVGALERLAILSHGGEDYPTALSAYERLLRLDASVEDKVGYLHQVALIQRARGQMPAAERAVRVAFDMAPGSKAALRTLLEFYGEAGDVSSIRVNLDRAAQVMRARYANDIQDSEALGVIARVLFVRERSGVPGSIGAAQAAAEIARLLGDESSELAEIAESRPSSRPRLEAFARADLDALLAPAAIPDGLRHILRAIRGRVGKFVGADPKRFGVGRGDRQKRGKHPVANLAAEMAAELGLRGAEVYVSSAGLGAAIAVPTDPISMVLGSRFASLDRASELTFALGRGLKLGQMGLALVDTMTPEDLDLFVAGIIRQFASDFGGWGQAPSALDAEQHRLRRMIPGSLTNELRHHALALVGANIEPGSLHAAMRQVGLRAGLIASTSAAGALAAALRLGGHSSIQEAGEDPDIVGMLTFALSEEHVLLQAAISEEASKSS